MYWCFAVYVEFLGDEVLLSDGLGAEMPSVDEVDDSRDRIGDASLCPPDDDRNDNLHLDDDEPASESDSEADEADFISGLTFDADDETAHRATDGDAVLGGVLSRGQSTVLAALSSPTVSHLMASAATALRDAVSQSVTQSAVLPSLRHTTDDDADVLDAEFEFLTEDDFHQTDDS